MLGSSEEPGLEALPEVEQCRDLSEVEVVPDLCCEVGKGLSSRSGLVDAWDGGQREVHRSKVPLGCLEGEAVV